MQLIKMTLLSLLNRKTTAVLTIVTIALGFTLLTGVEKVRVGVRESFNRTIVGTDLIVGARSNSVQMLLYTVFRLGEAPNNISWESYQEISQDWFVAWTVPISLGDSHKGYRVMGTSDDYFTYYKYGDNTPLALAEGRRFSGVFETVLGAEVADKLGYRIGDQIALTHGLREGPESSHEDKPFTVAGILAPTGTPVDSTIHIPLEGITAIHVDWKSGTMPLPEDQISTEEALAMDLTPGSITSFLIGLKSKMGIFRLQKMISQYPEEALSAVLPGIAIQKLWGIIGIIDLALKGISLFVVIISFLMIVSGILSSLESRRREIAVLRSVGVRPSRVFLLLLLESVSMALIGGLLGWGLLYVLASAGSVVTQNILGVRFYVAGVSLFEILCLAGFGLAGFIAGLIPAFKSYKTTLTDGLTVRL